MRSSSSPAAANAASRAPSSVRPQPDRERVPEEGDDVVLRLAQERLRVDREVAARRGEDVVVVEVAVDEHVVTERHATKQFLRPCSKLTCSLVEPARQHVLDAAKRCAGRPPQPLTDVDGDLGRLRVGQLRDVPAGPCALDQEGAAGAVATQQPRGAVSAPVRESIGLVVALPVALGHDLEHTVVARGRRVRVQRERERLAELDSPLRRDLARHLLERPEVGPLAAHPEGSSC